MAKNDKSQMTLKEVVEAKQAAEATIRGAVEMALNRFKERTGLCANATNVHLMDVTKFGGSPREYVVDSVDIEVMINDRLFL